VIGRSLTIGLVLLFLDGSSALVAQGISNRRDSRNRLQCNPIGRIISNGDRRFKVGSLLCRGDRLQVANGATVEVLCYANRKILHLKSGAVSNKCTPPANDVGSCTLENQSYCPKPKGPREEDNTPAIVSPYGSSILSQRPELSWYGVTGATSYTVQVNGVGVSWEKTVKNTDLSYPKEQPGLQFGNAYKITVIANHNEFPIAASTSTVNLLPYSDVKPIVEIVKRIDRLGLPQDTVASLDLDVVYMSKNLLHETIETLKSRVLAGSQNPMLYRVLGDRLLEAGLPESAKLEYTRATLLAKRADNSTELAKAQAGLQRIQLYSQLPTRTNGSQ